MPAHAESPAGAAAATHASCADWLALLDPDARRAVSRHLAAGQPVTAIRYTPDEGCFYRGEDPLHLLRQLPELLALHIAPRTAWPPAAELDPYRCNLLFHAVAAAPPEVVAQLLRYVADQAEIVAVPADAPAPGRPTPPAAADAGARPVPRVLKVDQERIDRLMNLIGELVVSKNALPFLARRAEQVHGSREMSREIKDQYAVIDRLAQEMQGAIMQVRMIPVAEVFDRFPRLVRDLARKLGKQIELVIEGAETAADKTIIEALADPLLHIVRNAIDHGIEPAGERTAAGKPGCATLRLSAGQQGDQVVIAVADDGRGIDPARIRRAAVGKRLLDAERAALLSDQEAVNLIFRAGFSTAAEVSDLSGRGVGMDVVRSTVDRLGGSVGVVSVAGQGTSVRMSLPLSMAITRVMTVEVAGTQFGIPMELIGETVRLDPQRVRSIKRAETFVLRDEVVPLRRLAGLLGMPVPAAPPGVHHAVLVVRVGDAAVGLVVDRLREGIDIILKPLDGVLAGLRGYAGTALLGDGSVLLVLDLKELL